MDNKQAARWRKRLKLERHPEGGYFREAYRSDATINNGQRHAATAIYYMLTGGEFSAFHRLKSDETWHHYDGSSLTLHIIEDGKLSKVRLGKGKGQIPQATVRANTWFAASLDDGKSYCLVGCTMSPGFHYSDWELGRREELVKAYPQYKAAINRYTII